MNLNPPPNSSEEFLYYWSLFIDDVASRPNVKQSHLYHLKILCDLCVEYDELKFTVDKVGRTYESTGRNGVQFKVTPEYQLMGQVVAKIHTYSKMLKLNLMPDTKLTNEEEEESEFD